MIKLNGESVNNAWEDYKGYLLGMGFSEDIVARFEPHFKQGFAIGESFASGQQVPAVHTQTVRKKKKTYTRNLRTESQRMEEERVLISYLKQCVRPMELSDVIKFMQDRGFTWNSKNSSSYLLTVMRGKPGIIAKTSRGMYQYVGGQV